jgi:hypothetical protein
MPCKPKNQQDMVSIKCKSCGNQYETSKEAREYYVESDDLCGKCAAEKEEREKQIKERMHVQFKADVASMTQLVEAQVFKDKEGDLTKDDLNNICQGLNFDGSKMVTLLDHKAALINLHELVIDAIKNDKFEIMRGIYENEGVCRISWTLQYFISPLQLKVIARDQFKAYPIFTIFTKYSIPEASWETWGDGVVLNEQQVIAMILRSRILGKDEKDE